MTRCKEDVLFAVDLRGVKCRESEAGSGKRARLLVTPVILKKLQSVWERSASDPNTVMLWAACCLGFSCFLRSLARCVSQMTGVLIPWSTLLKTI